jgi:hypothetical protein
LPDGFSAAAGEPVPIRLNHELDLAGNEYGSPYSVMSARDETVEFLRSAESAIVWHNSSIRETQIWLMDGQRIAARLTVLDEHGNPIFVGVPWSVAGIGDMNGDGSSDIVWHNSSSNETQVWLMDGKRIVSRVTVLDERGGPIFVGPPRRIAATGRLSGR